MVRRHHTGDGIRCVLQRLQRGRGQRGGIERCPCSDDSSHGCCDDADGHRRSIDIIHAYRRGDNRYNHTRPTR